MAWAKEFSHRQGQAEQSRSRRTDHRVLVQRLFLCACAARRRRRKERT